MAIDEYNITIAVLDPISKCSSRAIQGASKCSTLEDIDALVERAFNDLQQSLEKVYSTPAQRNVVAKCIELAKSNVLLAAEREFRQQKYH